MSFKLAVLFRCSLKQLFYNLRLAFQGFTLYLGGIILYLLSIANIFFVPSRLYGFGWGRYFIIACYLFTTSYSLAESTTTSSNNFHNFDRYIDIDLMYSKKTTKQDAIANTSF